MKKYLILIVVLIFVIYTLWIGRLFFMSRDFYKHGQREESGGKPARAVLWYGSAAKAYFPYNPYVEKSYQAISEIARKFKSEGNLREALRSYRELKASIVAIRSFYQPHRQRLKKTKSEIKKLLKKIERIENQKGRSEKTD